MIERYTLPEIGAVWSGQANSRAGGCGDRRHEANCRLGRVPQEALDTIKANASFEVERILEIEAEVRHDVIAFLTDVNEHVGDAGRHIHVGMTSNDVLDTGVALQPRRSVALLRVNSICWRRPCATLPGPTRAPNDRRSMPSTVSRSPSASRWPAGWRNRAQPHPARTA